MMGAEGCTDYWANGKVVDNQWEVDDLLQLGSRRQKKNNDDLWNTYLRSYDYIIDELVQDDLLEGTSEGGVLPRSSMSMAVRSTK